jgi:hypothetical protein
VNDPAEFVGTGTVTEFPAVVVAEVPEPPLILKRNVNGAVPAVPVNVITGCGAFRHTEAGTLIVAAGFG